MLTGGELWSLRRWNRMNLGSRDYSGNKEFSSKIRVGWFRTPSD